MAKVLLVKARNRTPDVPGLVPPLGILYLASILRAAGKHEVALLETGFDSSRPEDVENAVERFHPDVVGLSAITMEAGSLHALARRVKALTRSPVVAGGPHVSSYPEETLRDEAIDCIVLGEGERTMIDLVEALCRGADPASVPGAAVRNGASARRGPPRDLIADLNCLSFPAWDLAPLEEYFRHFGWVSTMGKRRYMALLTSRGCPYRCIYCHDVFGKRFRARSVENVLAEIDALIGRHAIRDFEIVDDIFNFDLPRAKRILDGIAERGPGLSIHFPNGLRCDRLDEEFLEKAKRAGLKVLCVAVETASPRLQRLSQKNLGLDRVRWAIDTACRMGILTTGFFMLGFPTETREEMRATVDFAACSRLHQAVFLIVAPFQGTELAERFGHLVRHEPADLADSYDFFRGSANMSAVPSERVHRIQRRAYWRFYLRPSRIWRVLRDHPRRRVLFQTGGQVLRQMFLRRHARNPPTQASQFLSSNRPGRITKTRRFLGFTKT